jgi:heavy metal-binding protein
MSGRREFILGLCAALGLPHLHRRLGAFQTGAPSPLPPVSWSCPMHPEVVDNQPGQCPICSMPLKNVRLALVWTCPVHTEVTALQKGTCPRCGRDLIRVTKALSFTCSVHRSVTSLDPGKCPRCRRTLVATYAVRPHGDHNPKHGGSFFMVSNNWHLEVTHPARSLFRLYIYDNYSKPFSPPGLAARIVESPDAAGTPQEVSIPFTKTGRGYYEARIAGLAVPAAIAASVRFEAGDKPYRFDFTFSDYSKEPPLRKARPDVWA